jgi:hypothetical protein
MNWMEFWFPFEGDLAIVRLTSKIPTVLASPTIRR